MSGPGVEAKGVKAHFVLDDSGILAMAGAEMSFEKTVTETEKSAEEDDEDSPLSKLGNTISKLFSGEDEVKPEGSEEAKTPEAVPVPPQSNDSAPAPEAPKTKITVVKESLQVSEERLDLADLAGPTLKKAKKK